MSAPGWRRIRLRFAAEVGPTAPVQHLQPNQGVTFLPLEAIWPDERYDLSRLRPAHEVKSGYTRFLEGDVLVPKITPTFEAARSAIAQGLRGSVGFGTTELHVLRPGAHLDAKFLWYRTLAHDFIGAGTGAMVGVAGQKRVPGEFIKDFEFSLPTLDDQRRIADFLDQETARLDRLVHGKQRLLALLEEKRAAVRCAAVSGERDDDGRSRKDSGLTWLPTMPSHWRIAKLSLVAKLGTGHTPSRSEEAYWQTERNIPWLTTSDIERFRNDRCEVLTETKESISRLGLENSSAVLHPAGTVALSRTASVGLSVIMGREMATSQDFVTWTCSSLLEPRFLLLCLRAMREDLLGRLAMGSTHKTIYMPDIQGLRIPLPPIDEQMRAVGRARVQMQKIDELSALIQRQLPLLSERRELLITEAVTGQLDPTAYRAPALTT
jgi:type I restriction enzyme, S subunit